MRAHNVRRERAETHFQKFAGAVVVLDIARGDGAENLLLVKRTGEVGFGI